MNSQKSSDFLNNQNLLVLMFKWRKPLIIVSVAAFVISIIASLLMTDMYKSTVTLFPSTNNSISKPLIGTIPVRDDILKFGEKEEAEQTLQILKSDQIRNRTVQNLNLIEYYNIDTLQPKWKAKLIEVFQGNITFNITKFSAVEIEVLDKSPEMAAKIANEIAFLIDTVKNDMQRKTAQKALSLVQEKYDDQIKHIKILEDSLKILMGYGIIDYESQVERYTEQLSIAILQNKTNAIKTLEEKLTVFSKYGSLFFNLRERLLVETKQLSFLLSKLQEAKLDANNQLSHIFIIDYATPADKKHSPKRMIIVLISVMSAFLLTFVFLLLKDSISNLTELKQD